jgi:catalase
MTTAFGAPVDGDKDTLSTGNPGLNLMQDVHFFEKMAHFNRERIPERVVHAKGGGAHGVFEVTHDITRFTRADFFSAVGQTCEVLVRFSVVAGERGAPDTVRDPRGFAVRFYTREGNQDIVGNNTPVFFIRDPIQFPDFIHSQKRNPVTNLKDLTAQWDFFSLVPESLHQVTFLFSDCGIPASWRHMDGHGTNTFMLYTRDNRYHWAKFHWKNEQGVVNMPPAEADRLAGTDPDYHVRDLYDNIKKGNFPSWRLEMQVMTPEQARNYRFDPFDTTKVWYSADFPRIPIGRMTLNRLPDNFYEEIEQAAFCPGNMVPGIGPSPDKMLQGRLLGYTDTQRHRLGPNFQQIPVNRAKAASVHNYQRDGAMSVMGNGGGGPNYFPNSFGGPAPQPFFAPPVMEIIGAAARHRRPITHLDFEQPARFYSVKMSEEERSSLVDNICGSLGQVPENIQYRQTALFYIADPGWGGRVARKLGLNEHKVRDLAGMEQDARVRYGR